MSKELEVFKKIVQEANECGMWHCATEIDIVEHALTPPTEQEVCEVLGEYLGEKVDYYKDADGIEEHEFKFADGSSHIFESKYSLKKVFGISNFDTHKNMLCGLRNGNLVINTELINKPHLITMIGRFYEGKVRK